MPSPSDSITLSELQSLLEPEEVVVVFRFADPASRRWLIGREDVLFDHIAGRAAIRAASDAGASDGQGAASAIGDLLFGGISIADGRPMIIVRDELLPAFSFGSIRVDGRRLDASRRLSYPPSVAVFAASRREQLPRQLYLLAVAATAAAMIVALKGLLWGR